MPNDPEEKSIVAPLSEFHVVGAAAANSPMTIEGPLIEIGALNENKWGIAKEEAKKVLDTLPGTPLKICSGQKAMTQPHSCDYDWDPKAEIGLVEAAYEKDGWIHARATVTDSTAKQKIGEKTWQSKWSVFLSHTKNESVGMLPNPKARAVTLVRNPAYPGAGFNVGGSTEETDKGTEGLAGAAQWDSEYINSLPDSAFAVVEPCYGKTTEDKNARHLPHHDKSGAIDKPHLRAALGRLNQIKPVCPDANKDSLIAKARAHLEKHQGDQAGAGGGEAVDYTKEDVIKVLDFVTKNPGMMDEEMRAKMFSALDKLGQKEGMKMTLDQLKKHPEMMDQEMMDMMEEMAGEITLKKKQTGGSMAEDKGTPGEPKYTQDDLDKAVAAAVEKEKTASTTALTQMRVDTEKMVAAAVEQAKTQTIEQLNKTSLIKEVVELQVSAGITKPEDAEGKRKALEGRAMASLEEDKKLLLSMKEALAAAGTDAVNKFKVAQLPASGVGASVWTVGRPGAEGKYQAV